MFIFQVGKAMEPTIILMDDCEKPFLKKKDKEDESKPFRWAKPLQGTIKVRSCVVLRERSNITSQFVVGVPDLPHPHIVLEIKLKEGSHTPLALPTYSRM